MKEPFLTVKDHAVSSKVFKLLYDPEMDLLKTQPQPSAKNLPDYYQSDNYISHTDASRNLFEKAYQFIKRLALKRKLKLINNYRTQTKNLLDFGCGTGDFLKIAKNDHWKITGIEPNKQARQIAEKKTDQTILNTEMLFALPEKTFDVITLWHVLEHLQDVELYLLQFKKLLKTDGVLIIAVPNFKSFDAQYYREFWAAYDVPRHLWHFSKTAILKLSQAVNMHIERIKPMYFDAYYVCLLSEKYKLGKMNVIKSIITAWRSNIKAKRSGEYSSLIYVLKK